MSTQINVFDLSIIILYIVGIVLLGLFMSRKNEQTSESYFMANKSLGWFVIGASLFASNISTVHLVGLAESGFIDGIVWGNFEWFSSLELLLLAFLFVPFYLRTKISTLPEFLEKRYDSRSRVALAVFSIFAALFMHIGVSFYAGAVVFENLFGFPIIYSILIIAVSTGIYAILGGLVSVVVTETLQTLILILGSVLITVFAILKLPEIGIHTLADLKAAVGADHLKAVSFDSRQKGFTFMDMLFGHMILGIWYWCTDQTIVQRVLGARSQKQAQLGAIFAGFLKILPPLIMVVPGILALALFKDQIGDDTKSVLPVMMVNLLPVGLKGLMVAALLAAVMSSVAAALNGCSTLVVYDIIGRVKPEMDDKQKIRMGRLTAFFVLLISVIWSPFLGNLGSIFALINQMFAIFAPSIVCVFLWGVLVKKGTSNASFYTLIFGSLSAMAVFIVEKYIPINGIENYVSNPQGLGLNWLRQTYLFFLFSSGLYFLISYLDKQKVQTSMLNKAKLEVPETQMFRLSFGLLAVLLIIYILFY